MYESWPKFLQNHVMLKNKNAFLQSSYCAYIHIYSRLNLY